MSRTEEGKQTALVGLLLLAHFTLRPFLLSLPVRPELLLGGLLLGTLRLRAGHAALLGFGLGLLESAMGMEGVGALSVVYSLIGYLGARSRDLLYADAPRFAYVYVMAGTWLAEIGVALVLHVPFTLAVLGLALINAVLTAVVCVGGEAILERLWR